MPLVCCYDFYSIFLSFSLPPYVSYFLIIVIDSFFILPPDFSTFSYLLLSTWGYFAGHAKLMVSLLQDMQANDQRSTMLQLVDKMKLKQKELGWFSPLLS